MTHPDPETVLAAIRECVTVVQPGEVLAVRCAVDDFDLKELQDLGEQAKEIKEKFGVSLLFVTGEEFARLIPVTARRT